MRNLLNTKHPFPTNHFLQLIIYLFVNILFILKYLPRSGVGSTLPIVLYTALIIGVFILFHKKLNRLSAGWFKILSFISFIIITLLIIVILIKVDPLSVRVDRWSAVTYFLDGLFRGEYPYAISTHVSETNFPSPFPAWHYINIPFYWAGDVGTGLFFYLAFFIFSCYLYTKSYRQVFFILLLLILSPAYWWEVFVRSDSLSNAMLVASVILIYQSKTLSLNKNFMLTVVLCGVIASTRLSAILPIAIYFFPAFVNLKLSRRISFLLMVGSIIIFFFLPYILWDTQTWIFFQRNPFMSQSSVGNVFTLTALIIIGVIFSLQWKKFEQYLHYASLFIFVFILISQISLVMMYGVKGSIFSDSLYDVSYFSLALPYSIIYLASKINILTPALSNS